MENNQPNKIMNNLYKRFAKLSTDCNGIAANYDYKSQEVIKDELKKIFNVVGAVEVMSKKALMQLIVLNGRLRAIPFHQFHFPFADSLETGYTPSN